MKYEKIKKICATVFALFVTVAINSQNKDDITVINYTAKFVEEISLSQYKDYNLQTYFMSEHSKMFAKEKVKYLPTIILYNNGEEVLKIESGIDLKLPENWQDTLSEEIEILLQDKF
jgi:thiol-disulfide isomerase/thioredoxin